jgi:hypothetical protein
MSGVAPAVWVPYALLSGDDDAALFVERGRPKFLFTQDGLQRVVLDKSCVNERLVRRAWGVRRWVDLDNETRDCMPIVSLADEPDGKERCGFTQRQVFDMLDGIRPSDTGDGVAPGKWAAPPYEPRLRVGLLTRGGVRGALPPRERRCRFCDGFRRFCKHGLY